MWLVSRSIVLVLHSHKQHQDRWSDFLSDPVWLVSRSIVLVLHSDKQHQDRWSDSPALSSSVASEQVDCFSASLRQATPLDKWSDSLSDPVWLVSRSIVLVLHSHKQHQDRWSDFLSDPAWLVSRSIVLVLHSDKQHHWISDLILSQIQCG